ncbi:hypothetical protein RJ640_028607 [Escallonia rubra]|uniref:Wall-associated receptor kinase galacturonan-binding domain-containing protein n=1 Tax=Escallonia rubra TaxID=112253 RepID=A0AA88UCY3_9ASTE|nr:hypothetical protein RJ640_028607 [Escallonia rubra]
MTRLERCGYPGFKLSCDNKNQTVLELPFSDDATDGGTGELYKIEDIDNTTAVRVILGTPIAVLWTHHRARSQRAVARKESTLNRKAFTATSTEIYRTITRALREDRGTNEPQGISSMEEEDVG